MSTLYSTSINLGSSATFDVGTDANEIVQLDNNARLPAVDGSQLTNLPGSNVTGALVYRGVYDATANNPVLTGAVKGDFYKVSVAGSLAGVVLNINDHIVFNQNASSPITSAMFDVVDNTESTETLDTVTTNGAITTNNITTGQHTVDGDVLPASNLSNSVGSESARFITTFSDLNGAVRFKAKNDQGAQITKGQVIYIKGISGDVPTVGLAQANSALTMPAFGFVADTANDQAECQIITFGNIDGLNTSSFSVGDTLYISSTSAGGIANTAPTGEANLIQNIGKVLRSHATEGIIKAGGAGRTNATPNLDQNKIFLGDANNQAVSTALSAVNLSSFNNDLGLATVATTGSYNDLSNTPSLATVATSGSYNDLSNTPTLGTASALDVGTGANNVVQLNASAQLPAVDGSNLTNITGTDNTKLAIANNLSDLNNVATARTNLGLATVASTGSYNDLSNTPSLATVATTGSYNDLSNTPSLATVATSGSYNDLSNTPTLGTASALDVGINANNVVQLDGSARLPAVDGSQLTNLPSGGASDLDGLSDVTITSVADGDTLVYNSSTSVFENIPPHMNIVELATTATSYTASPNDFVIIPDGHTGAFLYIRLPSTTVIGSTITVAVAGDFNFNTSKFIRCENLGDQIFLWDALSNSGNYLEEVFLENLTLVKFTLVKRTSSTNHLWYADFGLSYPLPLELTRTSSQNNEFRLNITDGSLLQWTAGQGTVGRGAFKDVALNTIALSSFNNDLSIPSALNDLSDVSTAGASNNQVLVHNGAVFANAQLDYSQVANTPSLATVATTGSYNDLSNTPTLGTASALDVGTNANNVVQLNGSANIDVSSNDIVTASNANIDLVPNGTGKVTIHGNATGGSGQIVLNCEQNSHGIALKSPPHSAGASYTLTFPNALGSNNQVLKTDASGNLAWVDQASGGGLTYQARDTTTHSPLAPVANYHYSINANSANFVINLGALTSYSAGDQIRIKLQAQTSTYNVTINANGSDTIDGQTNSSPLVLSVLYQAVTLVRGATEWEVI